MSEPTLYEALYILDTSLPEDEAAELIEALEETVREAGGEVVGTRDFRVRRLAYEIDRHTHGAYKLLYFRGDGEAVETLRSEMAVRQPIIRSRVFVANPDALVGAEPEAEAAIAPEETTVTEAEAVEAPQTPETEAEETPEAAETPEAPQTPETEAEEMPEAAETPEAEQAPEEE